MTEDLALLPPAEKKVAAKVLYDMGWSSRKIESWIGISDDSVLRAVNIPTPDELRQFEAEFRTAISAEKQRGIALGVKRLNELLPRERRVSEVVKGLEYLEGKEGGGNTVQISNLIKIE